MQDDEAYAKHPQHRKWFNKLWIAETFGYHCGPAGVDIPSDGTYVIRPIYNLAGMGMGAEVKTLKAGDENSTPPGFFWCEYFDGIHYSADYKWVADMQIGGFWEKVSCWEGVNMPVNLTKFVEWKRSSFIPDLPHQFKQLGGVEYINVEFIGDKIIEVHLRQTPDPDYDHLIPVWASDLGIKKEHMEMHGFDFIEDYDNADGHLDDPRIGFLVK